MTPAPEHTGPLAGLELAPFGFTRRCWVNAPSSSAGQQTADPVLGNTPDDLYRLSEHMADSLEQTLIALAAWIAEHRKGLPRLWNDF
jgi:hypothetical protein